MSKISKSFIISVVVISFVTGGIAGAIFGPVSRALIESERVGKTIVNGLAPTFNGAVEVVQEESATITVVEHVSPAVVSVITYKEQRALYNRTGPFLFDFFGEPFSLEPEGDGELRAVGGGSGFVISADGLIVTNRHVVDDDDAQYKVVFSDGREFDAEVKAQDHILDFALLKIEASNLPAAKLGDSDQIKIGQTVIAIGNALSEFENTVTRGIVSGVNRRVVAGNSYRSEVIEEAIQTDAAINPGNSGGPLVNIKGEVIGINSAVSQSGQLIGFAIPINAVKPLIVSFQENGRIVRPWLGVRYTMLNMSLADQQKLEVKEGAFIIPNGDQEPGVVPESPAAVAGLQEGDVIIEVGGKKVDDNRNLSRAIAEFSPGDSVELTVIRDGEVLILSVTLGELGE